MKHFGAALKLLLVAVTLVSAAVVFEMQSTFARLAPPRLSIMSPIAIQTATLRPGDTLVLETSHCVTGNEPVRVDYTREFVSSGDIRRVVVLLPVSSILQPGCETVETHTNVIPTGLPAGSWILRGTATVDGKVVPFATVPFDIN